MEKIYKGLEIIIERDEVACDKNPRSDSNLGTMFCCRTPLLNIGDHVPNLKYERFKSWDGLEWHIEAELGARCILPIYIYEHRGITISTKAFAYACDSGRIGVIYTTRDRWDIFMEGEVFDPELARDRLADEVDMYSAYLQGEVYKYRTLTPWDEEIDSCGSFYGSDHKELMTSAERNIDAWLEQTKDEQEFSFTWTRVHEVNGRATVKAHNKLEAHAKALELVNRSADPDRKACSTVTLT